MGLNKKNSRGYAGGIITYPGVMWERILSGKRMYFLALTAYTSKQKSLIALNNVK